MNATELTDLAKSLAIAITEVVELEAPSTAELVSALTMAFAGVIRASFGEKSRPQATKAVCGGLTEMVSHNDMSDAA